MPTYLRCDSETKEIAQRVIDADEELTHLREANVRIDLVFAMCDRDENDATIRLNDAITHQGHKALGLASIRNLKQRTLMGHDGEILLDNDWWETAGERQREALLHHELYHFLVKKQDGLVCTDDLGRPMLKMRKHDFEFGWFARTAARYGEFSQERIQAREIVMDAMGQLLFPELDGKIAAMPSDSTSRVAKRFVDTMRKSVGPGGSVSITSSGQGGIKITESGVEKIEPDEHLAAASKA